MLEVTILGCGSSLGVPVIGCNCQVCKSDSHYNKRTRSAIFIRSNQTKILVDFGFDIKHQLIREKIGDIDAAILTHEHADHVSGIDELRAVVFYQARPLPIYTDKATMESLERRYNYLFSNNNQRHIPQRLVPKPVDFFSKITVGDIEIQFFKQDHGPIDSLGIKIGDFIYSSDVIDFPAESQEFLYNAGIWVIDCLSYNSDDCHAGLNKILEWQKKYQPKQIFLTNMSHLIDYHKIIEMLPAGITPLYDGFKFMAG